MKTVLSLILCFGWFYAIGQDCAYDQLSHQFSIAVNPTFDPEMPDRLTHFTLAITHKTRNAFIQVITQKQMLITNGEYKNCKHVRSYQTGYKTKKEVLDNNFGDIVVADFNFDGMDDFAFINNSGGNAGPLYQFYIQQDNGYFNKSEFLTDSMQFFPTVIDPEQQQLITRCHASAFQLNEQVYRYDPKLKQWVLFSQRRLDL